MNVPGLCLIVIASLLANARADLSLVQKIEGSSINQITIKLKGDKARIEVSPRLTMIIDRKTGDMVNLMNAQKKFVRLSASESKTIAGLTSKFTGDSTAGGEKTALKPTGHKETVFGYEAEEYVRESPSRKEHYWIALGYPESAAILKQLQTIVPAAWNNIAKEMFDYQDFPGLPLRAVIDRDGKEIICTIISVKQDELNEAEFSVPKNFQELKVPNLQQILGEKSSIAPSSKP